MREVVIETTWSELRQPSGVFESETQLSNWEVTQHLAHTLGAYSVFINMNGKLSPEANVHNSQVTRNGEGEYLLAIVMRFPPETAQ